MQGSDDAQHGLPAHCLSRDPETGRVVIIVRGRKGFIDYFGQETPDSFNYRHGFSYEQIEAMEYGCQLGFDAELAQVATVRSVREDLGLPVGPLAPPSGNVRPMRRTEAQLPTAASAGVSARPGSALHGTMGSSRPSTLVSAKPVAKPVAPVAAPEKTLDFSFLPEFALGNGR